MSENVSNKKISHYKLVAYRRRGNSTLDDSGYRYMGVVSLDDVLKRQQNKKRRWVG